MIAQAYSPEHPGGFRHSLPPIALNIKNHPVQCSAVQVYVEALNTIDKQTDTISNAEQLRTELNKHLLAGSTETP